MEYSKIEKYSVITIGLLTIVLFFFERSYALGLLLGGLASLFAFKWLQRLENMQLNNLSVTRRTLLMNRFIRYLVYALVLLLCFLTNKFNYICCFIGLLVCHSWIILLGGARYD